MKVGVRVVRGPDWKWGNQDEGEGHVGTVVDIGRAGSTTSPDKTVVVQWDTGSRTNYRVGYQNAFDLRVFDNAPIGVKHPNIICDACKKHGIAGMRWKCITCYDFDLCTHCYMGDKHDLAHIFVRYDSAASVGVELPRRQGSTFIQAKGIFVGAKVVRGPDWDWGNQDGGDGKAGRVVDIRGWDAESGRSVANVTWTSGSCNVYRLSYKGKIDLKCIQEASGGFYYRDHLPVLGKHVECAAAAALPVDRPAFSVGDKVQVLLDVNALKSMQEGHGGWNPRMAEYIGKIGTVHRVTERSDIRVQYDGCDNRWTFHPQALKKVTTFGVGDVVRVLEDLAFVKDMQQGHGEWVENMKWVLGKTGIVLKVYSDGDLRVKANGQTWTLNPLCVCRVPSGAAELHNTMRANEREEHINPLASLLTHLLDQQADVTTAECLVKEAARGRLDIVQDLIAKYPDKVDHRSSGKTALQVAAHQGHLDIVRVLLLAGASLEVQDNDGDTPLHYAAFGNQPEVMEHLLVTGAQVDTVNKGRCSALHVAVNKQHVTCVRVLLKHKCNVNIQDSYGDTALHDAIGKESNDIVEALVAVAAIDFTLCNRRGFNVLHHAALKGKSFATERLLSRTRQIVDTKKDDGFAALHLAALNGHRFVAEILLTQGQCEVDIQNNRRQTPLLLAVSQGHRALIEMLVTMGASVAAQDEDGDTALHLAAARLATELEPVSQEEAPTVHAIEQELTGESVPEVVSPALAVACYLAREGEQLQLQQPNHGGKTAIDLLKEASHAGIIQQYASQHHLLLEQRQRNRSRVTGTEDVTDPKPAVLPATDLECVICCEMMASMVFEPCGHLVACEECSVRMKKCTVCQTVIARKLGPSGQEVGERLERAPVDEARLRYLESKIQEIEEANTCSICLERVKNVAFLCGHGACMCCAQSLRTCHMCRKPITTKINLY